MLQPCCNRSRTYPDRAGKRWGKKRQEPLIRAEKADRAVPTRKALTELTRRGSLVQIQHRPLRFLCKQRYFVCENRGPGSAYRPFCCNLSEVVLTTARLSSLGGESYTSGRT